MYLIIVGIIVPKRILLSLPLLHPVDGDLSQVLAAQLPVSVCPGYHPGRIPGHRAGQVVPGLSRSVNPLRLWHNP